MKHLNQILSIVALTALLSSCSQTSQKTYASFDEMVKENTAKTSMVLPVELHELMLQQTSDLIIVDVREPGEFESGHIPGAINVPRGILEFSERLTNRRQSYIIYSNHTSRATMAAASLRKLKFKKVSVLKDGWESWNKTYPEKMEEGAEGGMKPEAPQASSGGCGG